MRAPNLAPAVIAASLAVAAVGCSSGSSSPKAGVTVPTPSPSPSNSATLDRQLSRLVLPANAVSALGTPVEVRLFTGGNQVAHQVTLDACNGHFASESKRVARIQVAYVALAGGQAGRLIASNEVVRYSPGGTIEAFSELQRVARQCPARVRFSKTEVQTNFTVQHPLPNLGARQLTVTSLMHGPQQNVWSAATYLFSGDLFDGIYVYGNTQVNALGTVRKLAQTAYQRLTSAAVAGGLTV